MTSRKLWYKQPAAAYTDGLPIGSGRLAAMVLGRVAPERVAVNHEWLWRGTNRTRDTESRAHLLAEVRELLRSGRYEEGTWKANEAFGGPGGVSPDHCPNRVDPYQPAGDLLFQLEHGTLSSYRRTLDLDRALATVEYTADGVQYKREYLAHLVHDLILVRITADKPFGGRFWLARVDDPDCFLFHEAAGTTLALNGQFQCGIGFRLQATFYAHGGEATVHDGEMVVSGATEVLVAIDVGTSAKGEAPFHECARQRLPHTEWSILLCEHTEAYRRLYGAFALEVEVPGTDLPTDCRLQAARGGQEDAALPLLYFDYGRYLMISCTGTAELPPNLQGKWNEDLEPPWDADYHHDVNLQMNYWPVEAANLV